MSHSHWQAQQRGTPTCSQQDQTKQPESQVFTVSSKEADLSLQGRPRGLIWRRKKHRMFRHNHSESRKGSVGVRVWGLWWDLAGSSSCLLGGLAFCPRQDQSGAGRSSCKWLFLLTSDGKNVPQWLFPGQRLSWRLSGHSCVWSLAATHLAATPSHPHNQGLSLSLGSLGSQGTFGNITRWRTSVAGCPHGLRLRLLLDTDKQSITLAAGTPSWCLSIGPHLTELGWDNWMSPLL